MFRYIVVGFAAATLCGCSKSGRLPTYDASGTVRYEDGQPIKEGTVMLVAEGMPPGRGLIDDGKFTIGTYEERDGAVAGHFQVGILVSPPIDYDPDAGKPPVGAKAKYERPETSGIEIEVKADEKNEFEFVLERGK